MESRAVNAEVGQVRTMRMVLGWIGVLFLFAGIYGFFDPTFFGIFDLTMGHNWVHIITGAVYAYLGFAPAPLPVVSWVARIGGIVYALLGVVGFMVAPGTFAPLLVLGTNENVFHLVVGAAVAIVGFMMPTEETAAEPKPATM